MCILLASPGLAFSQEAYSPPSLSATPAPAEPPPMYVDRPGITNTGHVVGDGAMQVEIGGMFTTTSCHAGTTSYTAPLRFRLGTGSDSEFRLECTTLNIQGAKVGFGDIVPGFKYVFHETDGLNLAIVGSLEIPTGSAAFRAPGVVPTLSLSSDWVLADDWGLVVNAIVSSPIDDQKCRIIQPALSCLCSHAFTKELGGYVEIAAFGGSTSMLHSLSSVGGAPVGSPGTTLVDGGLSYSLDSNTQIDAEVFRGLTAGGFKWGGTVGVSKRW